MEKKVLRKVNQVGSMMIEALAMLALVSLVTPTLYKKAAERTMELQDINSATQIRALIKAADSYAAANFKTLVEELNSSEDKSKTISSDNLRAYLPEGYQLDSIKNFGSPQAAVKLGGTEGHETLTSYIVLPQKGTLNSIRSARIASMVGANGGIVEKDDDKNTLDGVGNIWKLDHGAFSQIFTNGETIQQYSVGAISEHAIDVGNSNSLENPKYLQRTHDDGEEWRNTMETTLYMGGTTDMDGAGIDYHSIEGVNRLIIGDTTWRENGENGPLQHDEQEALIIKSRENQAGSVWIEDSLTALSDRFRLTGNEDSFKLALGDKDDDENSLLKAEQNAEGVRDFSVTTDTFSVQTGNENKPADQNKDLVIDDNGALLNVNTKIDNTLETTGKTSLANTGEKTGVVIQPTVAADGENSAIDSSTSIYTATTGMYSNTTTVYGSNPQTRETAQIADAERNIIFDVQGSAYVNKALEVGDDTDGDTNLYAKYGNQAEAFENKNIRLSEADRELNVVGDAFVSDTLEAGFVAAHDFDAMNIHAGGKDYTDNIDENNPNMGKYNRWLNATENGVFVEDLGDEQNGRDLRMEITNNWVDEDGGQHTGVTNLYGPKTAVLDNQYNVTGYTKGSALQLGQEDAQLHGRGNIRIYSETTGTNKAVEIQNGAIIASGQAGQEDLDNTINMNAQQVTVKGSDGKLEGSRPYNTLTINSGKPVTIGEGENQSTKIDYSITSDVDTFTVQKTDLANGNSQKLLNVVSNENSTALGDDSVVGIDPEKLVVWSQAENRDKNGDKDNNYILKVDAKDGYAETDGGRDREGASVYIRRGAIEVEPFAEDNTVKSYAADEGVGYIEASRFVANNVDSNGNILKPTAAYPTERSDTYDRYMVNPAYTSVMHDIKLATRGGARLSDILPDFINKGIYLVTNTYKESSTPYDLRAIDASGQFASPYLGFVPAPTCPQGYAKVITLTPASFQMAQTGTLTRSDSGRFYITETNPVERGNDLFKIINQNLLEPGNNISAAKLKQKYVMTAQDVPAQNMWYLGYDNGTEDEGPTYGEGDGAVQYAPKPLYFQQSTWLKAATPSYEGKDRPCSSSDTSCKADRWLTIVGFLYPKGTYGALAEALSNVGNESTNVDDNASENANEFYWNLFPVGPDTIEAYATVYCYFDRTNIFKAFSGDDYKTFVKQYEPQPDDYGDTPNYDNSAYKKRLHDPNLKYDDPFD